MRLKTYFSDSVESALGRARRELGEETMLVNSRPTRPETRHLGQYEVVFAIDASEAAPSARTAATEDAVASVVLSGASEASDLPAEIRFLRREIERLSSAMACAGNLSPAFLSSSPALTRLYSELVRAEVSPELSAELLDRVRAGTFAAKLDEVIPTAARNGDSALSCAAQQAISLSRFRFMLRSEIDKRAPTDSDPGRDDAKRKIVALVGPPGSGKTSMAVKLAIRFGLTPRKPVLLLSTDTYRIAAAQQLQSYAAILGVPFAACDTPGAVTVALEEAATKELIIIDTSSHSGADFDNSSEMGRMLAEHPEIDVHIVLSATTKTADLIRAVERFQCFQPRKLIFTKLDETAALGGALELAVRSGKPISFLSTGQHIPEDFELASQRPVSSLVLEASTATAVAA